MHERLELSSVAIYETDDEVGTEETLQEYLVYQNPEYTTALKYSNPRAPKPPKYLPGFVKHDGVYYLPRYWAMKNIRDVTPYVNVVDEEVEWPKSFLEPFPHQRLAADKFFDYVVANDEKDLPTDGLVVMSTSAGKTVTGLTIASWLNTKVLVLVPTGEIQSAWEDDIYSCFGWEMGKSDELGLIRASEFKIGTHITIASPQTLANRDPELWNQFGMLIVDECHMFPTNQFLSVIKDCSARVRLGVTATNHRKDKLMTLFHWHMGHPVHTDLEARNSVPLRYAQIEGNLTIQEDEKGKLNWNDVLEQVGGSAERTEHIIQIVKLIIANYPGDILVTSNRISHVEELVERLEGEGIPAVGLTGTVKNRREGYGNIKEGKYRVTVGISKIVTAGASNPRWHHVVIGMPFSNKGIAEQLKGRPIRKHDEGGKKFGYVWDIIDKGDIGLACGRNRWKYIKPHSKSSIFVQECEEFPTEDDDRWK